jgi:hypothetical protein
VIPAGTVKHVDHEKMEISVDCTTIEIKAAPPYEPDVDDATYSDRLAIYYSDLYSGIG